MSDRMLDLLAALDAAIGVSGDERLVADVITAELDGHHDEHESDAARKPLLHPPRKRRRAHRDALCAHGRAGVHRPACRGRGLRPHRARRIPRRPHGRRPGSLASTARKGAVHGVTGAKPAHVLPPDEAKKAIPIDQLHVDVGTTSREETEALGVRVGDLATFARTGMALNGTRVFSARPSTTGSGARSWSR